MDFKSEQWLRFAATMPKRVSDFGVVLIGSAIYLFGGLTDCQSPIKDKTSGKPSRSIHVSTDVFKIEVFAITCNLLDLI